MRNFFSWRGVSSNYLYIPLPQPPLSNTVHSIPSYSDICHVALPVLSWLIRSTKRTFLYYCGGRELSLTSRAKNLDVSCFFCYYYYSTPSLTKACKSNSLVTFNNLSRACSRCGYDGQFPLERTANMYECYSGLYFIIQPRCHTNVLCECSVYHNARMSLARPLASKLINFEQPCTLIFSSLFPTSCRA